jgi:bacillopeptidase F
LQSSDSEELSVIVTFSEKADLGNIKDKDKKLRRSRIIRALRKKADSTQGRFKDFLKDRGAKRTKSLWIINGMAVTARADVLRELSAMPGIESMRPDYVVNAPVVTFDTLAVSEWNINEVRAPELWALGYTGQGVVVANMDTGVDAEHPDLVDKCRGGTVDSVCGGNSWFDPHGEHAGPHAANGHGTLTMGIMVGGNASGASIGVAPGAQWVAVKLFNDAGTSTDSIIHESFQWLLDPDGDPDTDDAPDVVNNSWGLEVQGIPGVCILEFQDDVQVLKDAGIAVAFSAGNDGPAPSTSISPANNPGSFGVGAVNSSRNIAFFSSRGPSACDGRVFPEVVAPGVQVKSSDLTFGGASPDPYATVSGTSFSAPHVAGAMALLLSAFPDLTVSELESALMQSAVDLGASGADNDYGSGLIDIVKAYLLVKPTAIGLFRGGNWSLDNGDGSWNAADDTTYKLGRDGDVPVTGDWDGDGITDIGLFRGGNWFLDNGDGSWNAADDTTYKLGRDGDVPVTGDWNGDGVTDIGLFRGGKWFLDNGDGSWNAADDTTHKLGRDGDVPVTGDWDGDGVTDIGLFRGGKWFLDDGDGIWGSGPDTTYKLGRAGDVPVTGDWDGDGATDIGLFRNGSWYLDDGDGSWSGCGTDGCFSFGNAAHQPVTGKWQ